MLGDTGTKKFEYELPIDARTDDVWKAISDGDELQRWFPISARIKPGLGGSIFLSWGPECEGEGAITLWEPGRKLGWSEKHDGGAVEISVVFEILSRTSADGKDAAVLRVTQHGFGRGAKWDDMYDSISSGWKYELRSLRHYLGRHKGADRRCVWLPVKAPQGMDNQTIWKRLCAAWPRGLCQRGSIGGHEERGHYELTGPDGKTYSGTCERAIEARMFAGTVREQDDALMRVELEPSGGSWMPFFWMSIWGARKWKVDEIGAAWRAQMEKALAG